MQRLFNLDKWTALAEGSSLAFVNPRPRTVRLEVNAPVKSALYVADADGEVRFLALVEGRDTIEFNSTGSFNLTVEGADVHVYTADGDDISAVVLAPRIFTKIAERRRRNPELERIAALMQANMERRLAIQANELRAELARREAALAQKPAAPGNGGEPPKEQPQVVQGEPPAPSAGAAAGPGNVPAVPGPGTGGKP